ncbi:Hypothetical Protein FCC1311_013162 [Hondaea fermentalgiana]|uniref:BZIP domain-containing protein n=1 Tax=Hondaea fermentalgiana TaxID=2315210 RepID=A0A2R5G464_9STRA|nr:Hypothetical Protein FCC1311_013162 [Hondaea fermentalgiana]|eukprot:GBG25099.1 Hypothetical Protein FCC1311_013162 [Hondaea fermentalgiana]
MARNGPPHERVGAARAGPQAQAQAQAQLPPRQMHKLTVIAGARATDSSGSSTSAESPNEGGVSSGDMYETIAMDDGFFGGPSKENPAREAYGLENAVRRKEVYTVQENSGDVGAAKMNKSTSMAGPKSSGSERVAGVARMGSGSGSASPGESLDHRNERNAEHCRKFREKRKRTMQELRERNESLLVDQEEFARRIAELRAEVDVLRHAGGAAVDLSLENQLLRMEVERHRVFVQSVLRAGLKDRPAEVSVEESYRNLRTGVDSTAGMMHGLLYTSVVESDPSWKEGTPIVLANGNELRLRYQYVPAGSGPDTARRLNLRIDAPLIQAPSRFVYEAIKHPYMNKDHMNHARHGVVDDVLPPEVAELADSLKDPMRMYKYRESETEAEMVLVTSARQRVLFASALRPEDRAEISEGDEGPDEATLIVQCSTPSSQLQHVDLARTASSISSSSSNGVGVGVDVDVYGDDEEEDDNGNGNGAETENAEAAIRSSRESTPRYVEAPLLLGCALVPLGAYRTHLVLVESYPLKDDAFAAFRHFIFPQVDVDTHTINKAYADDIAQVGNRFQRDVRGGPPGGSSSASGPPGPPGPPAPSPS